eukprot:g28513.t1
MHGLFELLLRERPEDPYAFMAKRFRQAAVMESQSAEAVLSSNDSTASAKPPGFEKFHFNCHAQRFHTVVHVAESRISGGKLWPSARRLLQGRVSIPPRPRCGPTGDLSR